MAWYAYKVFWNRSMVVADELRRQGVATYVPLTEQMVERGGRRVKVQKPLISSLLFVDTSADEARQIQTLMDGRVMLYTRRDAEGRRLPAEIPDREMRIFQLVVSGGDEGLEYIPEAEAQLKTGEAVRVIAGPLQGAEGRIVRIRGDRRLLVEIQGVCAVATSYIPRALLQPL